MKLSDFKPDEVQPADAAPALRLSDLHPDEVSAGPEKSWIDQNVNPALLNQLASLGLIDKSHTSAVPVEAPVDTSAVEALARGGAQGLTLGASDEVTGGAKALFDKFHGAISGKGSKDLADLYAQHVAEARAANAEAQAKHPYLYGAGNLAGGVASGALTGGLGAESALARIGMGAAQGAAAGVGYGNAEDLPTAGVDALKGGALGGGMSGGVEGVKKFLSPDALKSGAEELAVRGLSPNAPQYRDLVKQGIAEKVAAGNKARAAQEVATAGGGAVEAAAEAIPGPVNRLGRFLINNRVTKLGTSLEDKLDRVGELKASSGAGIGHTMDVLDQAGIKAVTPGEISSDIEQMAAQYAGKKTSAPTYQALQDVAEDVKTFQGDGFKTAQEIKNFVGEQLEKAGGYNTPSPSEKNLALRDVAKLIRSKLETSVGEGAEAMGDKTRLATYLQDKLNNGNSKIAEKILTSSTGREMAHQPLGLAGKVVAMGELAAGNPGKAIATAGALKAAKAYGYDAAALGADKLSNLVRTAPHLLGPFAGQLKAAADRGGVSLAVTNSLLSQTSPEYREHMKKLSEENK